MRDDAILITGGAGGIGRAVARRAAEAGWRPVTLDLHPPADPLPSEDYIACDFADAAGARAALAKAVARHAPTRLVNNVGIVRPAPLEETSVEDLAAVMDVNLRSAMLAAQALLPAMRERVFGLLSGLARRYSSVAIGPGPMAFTVMPAGASSSAQVRASPISPALLAV